MAAVTCLSVSSQFTCSAFTGIWNIPHFHPTFITFQSFRLYLFHSYCISFWGIKLQLSIYKLHMWIRGICIGKKLVPSILKFHLFSCQSWSKIWSVCFVNIIVIFISQYTLNNYNTSHAVSSGGRRSVKRLEIRHDKSRHVCRTASWYTFRSNSSVIFTLIFLQQ